jgi:hypothetical protein
VARVEKVRIKKIPTRSQIQEDRVQRFRDQLKQEIRNGR